MASQVSIRETPSSATMGDDVEEKYSRELAALKMNSKPLINSLTMMAEDFIQSAPLIVQIIEKHLARVRPEAKLPVLYLIDSIVKNIKKTYVDLFSQNIVATFCGVFESVEDRNVRGNLFKLRQTWIDVFPTKKLMTIDLRCSDLDEKWPIGFGLNPASTIHVNPKFLPSGQLRNSSMLLSYDGNVSSDQSSASEVELRKEFLLKQKKLLELQEKKIELELLEKQFNLEEQARKKKQQEEQANAKLLGISAQAEIAKQKTQAAASIIARSNVSQPVTQEVIETPPLGFLTDASKSHRVLRNPPEAVERVSRNPDTFPSDPRIRRTVILQKQPPPPPPPRLIQPWNSAHPGRVARIAKNPVPIQEHQPVKATISSDSPSLRRSSSPQTFRRRSKSKSPKREKKNSLDKSRGSSRESQGSSSGGRRSGGEEKASPQRSTFSVDVPSSPILSSSPGNRSQSPKHRETDRSERKRSRASSNSRRSGSEKEGSTRISREKEIKSSSESPKKSRDKYRTTEEADRDKFDRSSSSSLPSPTKKQRRSEEQRQPKMKKNFAEDHPRFDNDNENSNNGSSKGERIEKKRSVKEEKRGRRAKDELNSSSTELKARNDSRKTQREKLRETEREQVKSRTSAVLSRNYRKRPGIAELEEEEAKKKSPPGASDIDQRLDNKGGDRDVDFRKSGILDSSELSEPPSPKKSRNSTLIDKYTNNSGFYSTSLFGREDVDWRPPSASWSQVKKPNQAERKDSIEGTEVTTTTTDEQLKDILQDGKQRPLPPVSPASSVGSSAPSTCDALGRPLAFARLPDDPEERRRSLGSRSLSIDPVETFRSRYIETPLKVKGSLDSSDLEVALARCKNEVDQGILNNAQFNIISKQLVQLNEGIKIRQVQEMDTALRPGPGHLPNPWNPESNPIWAVPVTGFPRGPPMVPGRPEDGMWARGVSPAFMQRGPNPFEAINPVPDTLIPVVNQRELSLLELDFDGSTPLDKIPRQVRFYGNTAVVFVGKFSDEPKEISFIPEKVRRTLYIDTEPIELRWGVTRKFYYDNNSHSIRIGAPTRELIIDGIGHEVYFGGPHVKIRVDNKWVSFRLEGPTPGVKIGVPLRHDLVAGRTTIFVDGNPCTLYLDEKPQILDFAGFPVICQFIEEFRSITFNGRPFPTLFGGPPRPVTLPNGRRLYIRFNAISRLTEQNIMTWIRVRAQPTGQAQGVRFQKAGPYLPGFGPNALPHFPQQTGPELPSSTNPLDMVANLLPSTESHQPRDLENSYEIEPSSSNDHDAAVAGEEPSSSEPLNVQDLLNKLMLAGLLSKGGQSTPEGEETTPAEVKDEVKVEKTPQAEVTEETKEQKPIVIPAPDPPVEVVNVKFTDNLKKRRQKVIDSLYLGIQCGSCGLRFPSDQNYRYTQHLDWHFRHNRREKTSARKALSRKWYYDLSDWIQFEEVEELEDRATSVFDPQELDMDDDKVGGARVLDPDSYTVLAMGFEGAVCPQCGEGFEQFYDEEKEEWRLRDALEEPTTAEGDNEDKKLFHPICHQDYVHSLVEEEEPQPKSPPPPSVDEDDEIQILRVGPKEVVLAEVDIAEEDESKVKEKVGGEVADSPMTLDVPQSPGQNEEVVPAAPKPSASSFTVLSPVVIDVMEDESSDIPGMTSMGGLEGSVFGFALNSDSSHSTTAPAGTEASRPPVVYEAMKFDFPKIKEEPVEWKDIAEDQIIISSLFPHMSPGAEPTNITLDDDEDSGIEAPPSGSLDTPTSSQPLAIPDIDLTEDDVECPLSPRSQRPVVAEIDGNVQFRATEVVTSAPTKIKINIFGLDTSSQSPTHKGTAGAEDSQPALKPVQSVTPEPEKPQSPQPPDLDLESLFKSEEIRRLKPKLAAAGKKFVNNPVKRTGKEESGLCSIM